MDSLRWILGRGKSAVAGNALDRDTKQRLSRCSRIRLDYQGPSAVKDYLVQQIGEAHFEIVVPENSRGEVLLLVFHCALNHPSIGGEHYSVKARPSSDRMVWDGTNLDRAKGPVAHQYQAVVDVSLSYVQPGPKSFLKSEF